ncbi:hypothetical protein pb186bvf_019145 [Paramecium bursaria]
MSEILLQSRKVNPQHLPIRNYKQEILYALDTTNTLIVLAETGSGKTTCITLNIIQEIPQYIIEAGYEDKVVISLPRRMAAISIAQRVSDENNTDIGDFIGYRVRFESKINQNTRIEFVTDGTLIQMIMGNPLLEGYSVVMLDDTHDRTVNTDLLIALIKKIQERRPELKVIISSATLELIALKEFFPSAKIVYVEGRNYQVDIYYLETPCRNYVIQAAELCQRIHKDMGQGDILVFLTSTEEINAFIQMMSIFKSKMVVLPLYANLPVEKQLEVFKQQAVRKVIASTNLAESSVTIDGIVFVIDSCQQKVKIYDYKRNIEQLNTLPISQQQAQQRAGRAGRTRDGHCFRLLTQDGYNRLPQVFPPEILRSSLADLLLQIRSFTLTPQHLIEKGTFLTPVPVETLNHPLNFLISLHLLDEQIQLTELGRQVVDYPIEYKLAVCVENSFLEEFQCSEEILKIASVLSVQGGIFQGDANPLSILKAKKALGCKEGDVLSLHNIFVRYMSFKNKGGWCETHKVSRSRLESAGKIYRQLQTRRKGRQIKSSISDVEAVLRCLISGFFMNIAQKVSGFQEGVYRTLYTKQLVHLHPGSVLTVSYPEWVMYYEIIEHQNRLIINQVTEIDPHWLFELAPHFYKDTREEQAIKKHQIEKEELDKLEQEKELREQQKKIDQESKVVFGSRKQVKVNGFVGFNKPAIPIKDKSQRQGSIKMSQLSFNEDDF